MESNESQIKSESSKTWSVEDIYQYIGNIGWYQVYLILIVGYIGLPGSIGGYLVVFTQAVPEHRCYIPTLENPDTYNITDPELSQLGIVSTYNEKCEIIEYNECYQYDVDWESNCGSGNSCSNQTLYDLSAESRVENPDGVLCQNGYVWDQSVFARTAATDYELVCTSKGISMQVLTTSMNYVGFVVGSLVTGWICDSFGRKWPMMITQIIYSIILMSGGFTQDVYTYLFIRFIQGFFGISTYIIAFCYLVEIRVFSSK